MSNPDQINITYTNMVLTIDPGSGPVLKIEAPISPNLTIATEGVQGPQGPQGSDGANWTITDW